MPAPRPHGSVSTPSPGFTLLEILVVMALMAVLMGIGVGYLQNIGSGSRMEQARAILRETLYACKQSSNGGVKAIFDLRQDPEDPDRLRTGAAIAQPVLTDNFERLDSTSRGYEHDVEGEVEIVEDGYVGRCAKFAAGGQIVFQPQSAFAMTEGLRVDVWLKPTSGPSAMTILEGEGAYELQLVRDQDRGGYNVRFSLVLMDADGHRSVGVKTPFETKGAPIAADAAWTHLLASFDGVDVSIRVNGLEQRPRKRRASMSASVEQGVQKRLAVPEGGAVRLVLGSDTTSFVGLMDMLVLGGVFRSSDTEREIRGLKLVRPQLPVRIVWRNGRLDPEVHQGDVVLRFAEDESGSGPQLEFRVGLYGTIDERLGMSEP